MLIRLQAKSAQSIDLTISSGSNIPGRSLKF